MALCEQVAEHARRGILDKLVMPRTGEQPPSMLGDVAGEPGVGTHVAGFWNIDLDGDSVLDRLAIDAQGTMTDYDLPGSPSNQRRGRVTCPP